jgi:hypothetical protein
MKLKVSYIQNTQQWKVWPQRGGESTLTLLHFCHSHRIPFGHVLIERKCIKKHCKRGCNQEKKDQQTNPPQTTKKEKRYRFINTKQNNKTFENCDPMKLELSYTLHVFKIHNSGRCGHREGERVHLLLYIFVTAPVFHFDTS